MGADDTLDGLMDVGEQIPRHRHDRRCKQIVAACYWLHCASCGVVTPARGLSCGECGHVWRTGLHLLLAHWRAHIGVWWKDWRDPVFAAPIPGDPDTLVRIRWWHLFVVFRCWRPGLVWVCPCCIHDL